MFSRRSVDVGGLVIGGDSPVAVQSMTNTPTANIEATLAQIRALATAGADLVRVAVPDGDALAALPRILGESSVPIVADVHFDHRLAVGAVAAGAAGVRVNPGNIGGEERVREVIRAAEEYGAAVRIGVNSGSLQRDLRSLEAEDPAGALVESAVRFCAFFEDAGFTNFKVSVKSSSPVLTIDANRRLSRRIEYPLHLGVTEAGTPRKGAIRSAVALGALLAEGVGDTIRVSLTGDPVEEIEVAREILRSLGLLRGGPRVISCPTCGRTQVALESLALEVEERLEELGADLEVAVMGCVVNGPGEARKADFGIAGGRGEGVVFARGRPVRKVSQDRLVDELFEVIEEWRSAGRAACEGEESEDRGADC